MGYNIFMDYIPPGCKGYIWKKTGLYGTWGTLS